MSFAIFSTVSVRNPRSNARRRSRASRAACSRRRCSAIAARRRSSASRRRAASALRRSAVLSRPAFLLAAVSRLDSLEFFFALALAVAADLLLFVSVFAFRAAGLLLELPFRASFACFSFFLVGAFAAAFFFD